MKISPITGYQIKNNKNIYTKQHYKTPVIKNNARDSFSFTGECIRLSGYLNDINDNEFPEELYLDLDKVLKTFEKQDCYNRFEQFPFVLADLLAKRCNYLGLTQSAVGSGYGSSPEGSCGYPRKEVLNICEYSKNKNNISIEYDWTREFNELNEFFNGVSRTTNDKYSMEKIKEGLPEILRNQGWIK